MSALPPNVMIVVGLVSAFVAVVLLVYSLFQVISRGLQSYEEKYVAGASRSLDAMYLTMTPTQVLYLALLCSLVVTIVVGVSTLNVAVGLVAGGLSLTGPSLAIRFLKWRRDRKFGEQLVDALVGMGNALRAGHSLPAALELIAREIDNPMGQEMRLVVQEMRLGVSMENALRNLHTRMPNDDLDILITSILISRELGGNLAEVFDNIAYTIRERHRIEGKIRALTAQGKLQGGIICMLPVLIFIFLNAWSPELMRPMYTDWVGWLCIGGVVVLMLAGVYMIWKIVTIEI